MRYVETTVELKSPPEKVIEAFLDPLMLNGWWGIERSLIERHIGGLYHLAWNISEKGFGYISTGLIKTYDPSGLLIIDKYSYFNPDYPLFGPMSLTVKADKIGSGSMLVIRQDGYRDGEHWEWYYNAVKGAWPLVASKLKEYLENGYT